MQGPVLETLLNDDIIAFIRDHAGADVRQLALTKMPPPWPRAAILDQIRARQKAKDKIPDWLAQDRIILPSVDLLEQCSSTATAQFKASLVGGDTFVDLTAGAGIDTAALATRFPSGIAVERDQHNADCLSHNLPLMHAGHVHVQNTSAEDFIATMPPVDLAFIDPQRRSDSKRGIMRLEETSPNILDLLPALKAKQVLLKTSPVLDIDLGIQQLGHVSAVHVLEWRSECKEILFLRGDTAPEPVIHAHRLNDSGQPQRTLTATRAEEENAPCAYAAPSRYLYEPGPAFMKAGLFRTMAARYGVKKLHPSTHLYTSEEKIEDFPGRIFEIMSVLSVDKKSMPSKANLAIRNFPGTVDDLKKKLGIKDGGSVYLFACTLHDEQKRIIACRK